MSDSEESGTGDVVVRGGANPLVTVRLSDLEPFFDEKTFVIAVRAKGLEAEISGITITPWDQPQLDGFFTQLAADYAGWEGVRTWRSSNFVVDARFESGGHVALT